MARVLSPVGGQKQGRRRRNPYSLGGILAKTRRRRGWEPGCSRTPWEAAWRVGSHPGSGDKWGSNPGSRLTSWMVVGKLLYFSVRLSSVKWITNLHLRIAARTNGLRCGKQSVHARVCRCCHNAIMTWSLRPVREASPGLENSKGKSPEAETSLD